MKVIIAGSRNWTDYDLLKKIIQDSGFEITEVVCGEAKGADTLGKKWAQENNIPVKSFPAKWDDITVEGAVIKTNAWKKQYNAAAGGIRNGFMAEYADALILTNKDTDGSGNMYKQMSKLGKPIYVYSDSNYVSF